MLPSGSHCVYYPGVPDTIPRNGRVITRFVGTRLSERNSRHIAGTTSLFLMWDIGKAIQIAIGIVLR